MFRPAAGGRLAGCVAVALSAALMAACSEAPLDLIWADVPETPPGSGTGGGAPAGGGGAPGATGGEGGLGGSGDLLEPCEGGGEGRFFLKSADRCLSQGALTTVGREAAFQVEVAPCDGSVEQLWELLPMGNAHEIRHLATEDNLDIRMAASVDGTPAVLYDAHAWHNQQFFVRESALGSATSAVVGGSRWLAPRHAELQCLTYLAGAPPGDDVQIWPCNDLRDDQKWSIEPLVCPVP